MIGTLLRNELRMLLRDTRTILIAVVAPLVILPAYILITGAVDERESERIESATYGWAIVGDEAQWGERTVRDALELPADSGTTPASFDFTTLAGDLDRRETLADSLLRAGDLQVVVEARAPMPADSLDTDAPVLSLRYRSDSDLSRAARDRLGRQLRLLREQTRDARFREGGLPVERDEVAVVTTANIATAEDEGGRLLARILLPFVLLLMLSGGSIIAADTISGEKERGTLETLLTSAAGRRDIVRAKLLGIVVVGLAVVVVNVINLALYLTIGILDLPEGLAIGLAPTQLVLLLLLLVPMAGLVAAALLLVSGLSKSYREYQLYSPVLFIVLLLPSLAAVLPGIELDSVVVAVPIAGLSVAVSAVLGGGWQPLWGLAAVGSTGLAAAFLVRRVEIVLSNERLISSAGWDEADFHGGAALFPRRVLTWFLGFWVLFFLVSLWFGESLGIRGQIVVNLVGVFLGGSAWLIHRYRLDPVPVLSLRAPGWTSWPAVLIGAPSFLVLGMGVGQLVNTYLFPIPQSVLESFARGLTLDLGLMQLVFFLAVLPGILEEIAFRGVLLHGLRRRLASPWTAAIACGVIFGLFHVSLFRIVPTGLLGVMLAVVVIRTRSIYPAMLWHFLNNAIALVPTELGWVDPNASIPGWGFALAGGGLVISFLLLTPRPDPFAAAERLDRRASG